MVTAETPVNVGCSLRLVGESKRGEVPKFIVDAAREIALELERSGLQRKQIAEKIGVDKGRMARRADVTWGSSPHEPASPPPPPRDPSWTS